MSPSYLFAAVDKPLIAVGPLDIVIIAIGFLVVLGIATYGVLITGAGLFALVSPPPAEARVALFELHADVWWGALMAIVGLAYCLRFNPRRNTPQ